MRIIDPVVVRPWLEAWKTAKAGIASSLERAGVLVMVLSLPGGLRRYR